MACLLEVPELLTSLLSDSSQLEPLASFDTSTLEHYIFLMKLSTSLRKLEVSGDLIIDGGLDLITDSPRLSFKKMDYLS